MHDKNINAYKNSFSIFKAILELQLDSLTSDKILNDYYLPYVLPTIPIKNRPLSNPRLLAEINGITLKGIYGPLTQFHTNFYKSFANNNSISKNIAMTEMTPYFSIFYKSKIMFNNCSKQSKEYWSNNYLNYITKF